MEQASRLFILIEELKSPMYLEVIREELAKTLTQSEEVRVKQVIS